VADKLVIKIPYRPNPKQAEFHSLQAKFRGFCGGWGNGKTSGGCAEFFMRLMEFPGTNSIVSRKTRPELRTTTWAMLMDGDPGPGKGGYVPWHGIPKEVIEQYNKSDLYVKLRNGSQIHGLPLDDPKKLENYNLGLFMCDQAEEVEEDVLLKVHGRLRQHVGPRESLWLFNPNGHNYLWRRFLDPRRRERWTERYKCIEATPFDNPNLPEDYMDQFDSLPSHWYDRYVLGSHEVFVGQIFVEFLEDRHVIEPFYIPPEWERWCAIDPGIGHEGAVVWIARDWDNNCYVYRELVEKGRDVPWWAEQIEEMESRPDIGGPDEEIYVRLIGPEANQRSQNDARTVKGVFEEEGIELEVADRDPLARINRISGRLRPQKGHDNPIEDELFEIRDREGVLVGHGAPSIYFFSSCDYTVEHLPQYRWRPTRTNFTEEDAPEKPRKRDDHTVDCIGHIVVAIGDSEPDVPENSRPRSREEQWFEEHFEREVALAASQSMRA
jgi:phage terminase large subunit